MTSHPVTPLGTKDLTLETQRLILRPFSMDDLDLGIAILTDERVTRYVCDVQTPQDVARDMPRSTSRGAGGRIGIWAVTRKDTGAKIGTGVLLPMPVEGDDTDWSQVVPEAYPQDEVEVGYMLVPDAWGKGYATETCRALLEFGFTRTELSVIRAVTDLENTPSQHVLRKSGMDPEGTIFAYGEDVSGFRLNRADWEARGVRT